GRFFACSSSILSPARGTPRPYRSRRRIIGSREHGRPGGRHSRRAAVRGESATGRLRQPARVYCSEIVLVGAPSPAVLPATRLLPKETMAPPPEAFRPTLLLTMVLVVRRTVAPELADDTPLVPLLAMSEPWTFTSTPKPPEKASRPLLVLSAKTLPSAATRERSSARRPKRLCSRRTFCSEAWAKPATVGLTRTPPPALSLMTQSLIMRWAVSLGSKSIPAVVNLKMTEFSTLSPAPARKRIPLSPVPMPLMSRPRRVTTSLTPALTTMPLVPETRTP